MDLPTIFLVAVANPQPQIDQYRKNAVNGATPLQLVVMLYDGALRFVAAGKRAMLDGNVYEQNKNLQRAQKIVAELISSLDMNKGADIAQNLLGLYSFCYNKLVESNLSDATEGLDQVTEVLGSLRTSWVELEKSLRSNHEQLSNAA